MKRKQKYHRDKILILNSDIIEGLSTGTESSAPFCIAIAYRSVQETLLERSYASIMRAKTSIVVYWMCLTPDKRSCVVARVHSYDTFYRRAEKNARKGSKLKKKSRRKNPAI